jgi:hypothetical protein
MSLFHSLHHVGFSKVDPLGGGLREEITSEENDPQAIQLQEGVDEEELSAYWRDVEQDIENDPTWFHFEDEKEL